MRYSNRLLAFLFGAMTAAGAYWIYRASSQIYNYCFGHSVLWLRESINCSNVLLNITDPPFAGWILTTIGGAAGLTLTARHVSKQSKKFGEAIITRETNQKIAS